VRAIFLAARVASSSSAFGAAVAADDQTIVQQTHQPACRLDASEREHRVNDSRTSGKQEQCGESSSLEHVLKVCFADACWMFREEVPQEIH
jgi:hypothetical protein